MKVVSLVPSWTETLLTSGVEVVGRTRFCVHPKNLVKDIPVVGGTKDWNWDKILKLQPTVILLDKEENPLFMAEQNLIPIHATHVQSVHDMPSCLLEMSAIFANPALEKLAERWQNILQKKRAPQRPHFTSLPGLVHWGKKPEQEIKTILYMIWKDPWMCVSKNTFIGSVLVRLGMALPAFDTKYPQINLDDFIPEETLILFSSEPYPFFKKKTEFQNLQFPHAFVDGESFSWFGSRTLEFLEMC